MKRVLILLLTLAMVFCLAACGGSSVDWKKPAEVDSKNKISTDNRADTPDEDVQTDEKTGPDNHVEVPKAAKAEIEEVVIFEEQGIKVTAKSLDPDALFGPELKLLIENDSGKNLTFQCWDASVNGYMVDTMMSVDVSNGKKANDELTFLSSDLELCGITEIADMEFSLHIFDAETWDSFIDSEMIQIKTSLADSYTYRFDDSGEVAYEGNGIKIVVKGLREDGWLGPGIVVYIENDSGKNITVQSRDESVNGFMVDAFFSSDIISGKRCIDTITFMDSDLEENEITAIENVELSFYIYDQDSWDTIVDTGVITIDF